MLKSMGKFILPDERRPLDEHLRQFHVDRDIARGIVADTDLLGVSKHFGHFLLDRSEHPLVVHRQGNRGRQHHRQRHRYPPARLLAVELADDSPGEQRYRHSRQGHQGPAPAHLEHENIVHDQAAKGDQKVVEQPKPGDRGKDQTRRHGGGVVHTVPR
jgi:hypothetical protein